MTLPTPPKYVVIPEEYIEQAYAVEKPRRALLASFMRILSLAWQSKYQQTPPLHEEELMTFLKLSRRQYFEQKADMESLGWLRSSHTRPGFVQFSFSRVVAELVEISASAENRTTSAENRTELMRIEEEDSLISLNTESSSSSSEVRKIAPVRKTALKAETESEKKMQALIENLHLLFDPELYGLLEWREIFLAGIPERALAWIAKAYQDRERLNQGGGPIGLIVKHLIQRDEPHRYFREHYAEILPESYLEAVDELELSCEHCPDTFHTRASLETHKQISHPYPCTDCADWFMTEEERKAHWMETHDPYRVRQPVGQELIPILELDGTVESTWQAVLHQLQEELPKAAFETWVRDTAPIRYDGNVLTIATRNTYARDWLANRLTTKVNAILATLSETPIVVGFVVAQGESA